MTNTITMNKLGHFLVGTLLLFLLLYNASPNTGWEDSGELTTSSFFLSISHPPGFPLYSLFLKVFNYLPFGNIAYRANVSSALLGFCCLFLFYSTLRSLKVSFLPILIGLFFLLATPQFLLHAGTCEVYMFFLFLLSLAIRLFVFFAGDKSSSDSRIYYSIFLLVGLSASLNPVFILFFIPILVGLLWTIKLSEGESETADKSVIRFFLAHSTLSFLLFFLGLSISLYLIVRGTRASYYYWGPLLSAGDFINHVTALSYRSGFGEIQLFPSFIVLYERLRLLFSTIQDSAILYLWPFIIIGIFSLKTDRTIKISIFFIFFLDMLYTLLINPMGIQSFQTSLVSLYCLAFFAAYGLEELCRVLLKT